MLLIATAATGLTPPRMLTPTLMLLPSAGGDKRCVIISTSLAIGSMYRGPRHSRRTSHERRRSADQRLACAVSASQHLHALIIPCAPACLHIHTSSLVPWPT